MYLSYNKNKSREIFPIKVGHKKCDLMYNIKLRYYI